MVVVDTSVLAKWFLPEPDSAFAVDLRRAHVAGTVGLVVPDFALIELGNVLRYKFPAADAEIPVRSVKSISSLGVQVIATTPELVTGAVTAAYTHGLSVYDAIYVTLAEDLGFDLITADIELQRKCKALSFVRLLKDWKAP